MVTLPVHRYFCAPVSILFASNKNGYMSRTPTSSLPIIVTDGFT